MKFIITSTSGDKIIGTTVARILMHDRREWKKTDFPKEHRDRVAPESAGFHQFDDETSWRAERDTTDVVTILELSDLDGFLSFVKEHGQTIVTPPDRYDLWTLEVYDSYRE